MSEEAKSKPTRRQKKLTSDKPLMWAMASNIVLILAITILVLVRLRSHNTLIPVEYVVEGGKSLHTSIWYTLYGFIVFAIACGGLTISLALQLYKHNRWYGIVTLIVYAVILIFSLLSINGLLNVVSNFP